MTLTKRKRFRLSKATMGVRLEGGKAVDTVQIPCDSVIEIVSGIETQQKMIEIDWRGLRVMVFARDVQDRGELVGRFQCGLSP